MAKKKPIRVGIAGLGRAGWSMQTYELDERKSMFKIVAACDVEQERCDKMAERYGCATYLKIEDLVKDPDVELVSIATRSPDHVRHAKLALKAGKSVFVEKPMATTYEEAKKLKPAAAKAKGKLFVRHNRRFEAGFQHVREIIASGVLGKVFEIKLRRMSYQRRDDWQTIINCGGGQLLNWGPHIIDHGLQFLESPLADLWSDLKLVAAVGDAEDHLKIIMRGKNGRVIDLEISGGAALGEREYIVLGSKGALMSDGSDLKLRYIDPKQKLSRERANPGTPGMEAAFHRVGRQEPIRWIEKTVPIGPKAKCKESDIWNHLYASMRERKKFPITLDQALEVMKVVSMVKEGTPFAKRAK